MKKEKSYNSSRPSLKTGPKKIQTITLEGIEFSEKQVLSVSDIKSKSDLHEIWNESIGGMAIRVPTRMYYCPIIVEVDIKRKKFEKLFQLFEKHKKIKMVHKIKLGRRKVKMIIEGYLEYVGTTEHDLYDDKVITEFSILPQVLNIA